MINSSDVETGLWEAWIEFDHLNPAQFGMLYVMGELQGYKKQSKSIKIRRSVIDTKKKILSLHIDIKTNRGKQLKEIIYSEPINAIDQYALIIVYAGSRELARFEEVEFMI